MNDSIKQSIVEKLRNLIRIFNRKRKKKIQPDDPEDKMKRMETAVKTILEGIGEDPARDGLVDTPSRVTKALLYMTKGYHESLPQIVGNAVFEEHHSEMVLVRDIDIFSLCEHHMVPFLGKVHIAYIPRSKVLGLSKLARIAEIFSRRLQVQERLTKQIAEAVKEAISPRGVAVVIQSTHMCMVMRGVQKSGSSTMTTSMTGCFEKQRYQDEFFALLGHPSLT
jgi:GTP cyclohydrolase I